MEKYSIVVTCVNETVSLIKTLEILIDENNSYIKEIIIVYPNFVHDETFSIIKKYSEKYKKVLALEQTKPFVGGAVQDAFDIVKGEYTIMMGGDLETDPYNVKIIIKNFEKDNNLDVVTASRWADGGSFDGYGWTRVIYNYLFNKLFAILYDTNLTDMTFGYRGFKTSIIKNIDWENYKHSFFFETIIKPKYGL